MLTGYFDPATKLIYAAGAIVGLIGAIKVYSKFSSGAPDPGKTAGSWFGACVFLIVFVSMLYSMTKIRRENLVDVLKSEIN